MQKRAGILFISKKTSRILLILEDFKWAVPTFSITNSVIEDSEKLIIEYFGKKLKLIPVELYQSQDLGFEYSTYACLVDSEFLTNKTPTICWASISYLPKQLHSGLKSTLNSKITQAKIETIVAIGNEN
jgi:hypothetical protein